MGKSSKSLFIGALASTLVSGVAYAADYSPPPVVDFEPEYHAEFGGGLYLRGHIGISNQQVDSIDNVLFQQNAEVLEVLNKEFEGGAIAGLAIGYRFNDFFRVDAGVEYRAATQFYALDRYDTTGNGIWDGTNQYEANKSEWLFLANAFMDLGTYAKITPYVGAGAGVSMTTISNFTDTNVPNQGVAYAQDNTETNFAWALYGGLGYEVNDHVTLELGYRYLNMGDAASGDIIAFGGANNVFNPLEFEDVTSHDIMLGMRWNLGGFGGHDMGSDLYKY